MRLKSIKLAGFKSFVDPTTVPFPTNLAAVVGPNGCGKSNIIDAVRWVMGESSAKHLRGESMTDVIFNGSTGRKPVGQASIELVFDNSDGTVVGEYAKYNEISVRRKVTREGQSLYFLNGTKCRRRDITDIFLGTGLGPRSYAIIEQGMISRLIESKPEELRSNLEEAAGISKYKERRKEALSRMKRTQENLARVSDLREELGRQLEHLHKQAKAAEKYTELKSEERIYKAQLLALKWQKLDEEMCSKQRDISELDVKFESHVAGQRQADTVIEELRLKQTELSDFYNDVQSKYYKVGGEIGQLEQSIKHQEERHQRLAQDMLDTERSLKEVLEEQQRDKEKLEELQEELLGIEPELELLKESEEEASMNLQSAEDALTQWQHRWETFNAESADAKKVAEVQQSRMQQLEKNIERHAQRSEKLKREQQSTVDQSFDEDIQLLQEQVAQQELTIEAFQQQVDQALEQIENNRSQEQSMRRELDTAKNQLQQYRGRFSSLEALQQAALGSSGNSTNTWLEKNQLAHKPRLADQLQVNAGWEKAVETVLSSTLQAVSVDSIDQLQHSLEQFQKGAITFFESSISAKNDWSMDKGMALSSQVSASFDVTSLFSGVYGVDDLTAALELRKSLSAHESIITKDGLWLGPNWLRVMKGEDSESGVLARKQEISTLEEQIAELEDRIEELEIDLETVQLKLKNGEQQRDNAQRELTSVGRQLGDLQAKLSSKQARAEQLIVRREQLENELKELTEQGDGEELALEEARELWHKALASMEDHIEQREVLQEERAALRDKLEQTRQQSSHARDNAHQLEIRFQSLTVEVNGIQQSLDRLASQKVKLEEKKQSLIEQRTVEDTPIDDLKESLQEALENQLTIESKMKEAKASLESAEHDLRTQERKRSEAEKDSLNARSKLEQERMAAQALEIKLSAIVEQLQESEFKLAAVLEALPEEATISNWEEALTKIAARIQRLGAINLAAIEEYKIQSERKEYLDAQNSDLEKALSLLEDAIRRIDTETRTRFKETFDRVNSGLQELFPKVFGGGSACLELTSDDLLETGVAIMARPPGKKNSTIHLLSGGEKALTAIALVFSIFRLNPAPFCMLDEVDAPLDDANVGRYARLVKAMSAQVQFIYITHNKIAMEMADNLMGVTMHEPGVSRLVSVNVEEAVELVG